MRTSVTFRHPAPFVALPEVEDVLAVAGADWFASTLKRIPNATVDENICQEDWGVVFFVRREERDFWIGLSKWDEEGAWTAHFHHGSFAWLQRFRAAAKDALRRLLVDVHSVLSSDPSFSEIAWQEERQMTRAEPASFPTPVDD
jgi:hypothetical protein